MVRLSLCIWGMDIPMLDSSWYVISVHDVCLLHQANLDPQVRVRLAKILCCRLTVFPFVINFETIVYFLA